VPAFKSAASANFAIPALLILCHPNGKCANGVRKCESFVDSYSLLHLPIKCHDALWPRPQKGTLARFYRTTLAWKRFRPSHQRERNFCLQAQTRQRQAYFIARSRLFIPLANYHQFVKRFVSRYLNHETRSRFPSQLFVNSTRRRAFPATIRIRAGSRSQ
jgi:hypothetical protein